MVGGLTFALISTGAGLAVAMAAFVHSLCTRARPRRWMAATLPTLAWLYWFHFLSPPSQSRFHLLRMPFRFRVRQSVELLYRDFAAPFHGNRIAGFVLFVSFAILLSFRLSRGLRRSANIVAWSAAAGFWWYGVVWSRGFMLDDGYTFRYTYVTVALLVLAALPGDEAEDRAAISRLKARWDQLWVSRPPLLQHLAGPIAVMALYGLLMIGSGSVLDRNSRSFNGFGTNNRSEAALAAIPGVLDDSYPMKLVWSRLDAGDIRRLFDRFGAPPGYGEPDPSIRVTASIEDDGALGNEACRPPDGPIEFTSDTWTIVGVPTAARPADVRVRRFGSRWVTIGSLEPGSQAVLRLSMLGVDAPWELDTTGICVAGH